MGYNERMESWHIILGLVVVLVILNTERQVLNLRQDLAGLDRKLSLILRHFKIEEFSPLSERVKELARQPRGKIEAIKVYREETGAGLAEAKEAVEAFIKSLPR